jgi:PAS domain S-box-containing protein
MTVDLQTLILITGLMHLVQALVFYQQYRTNRNMEGPGWWLVWSLLEVLAFFVMMFRGNPVLLPFIIAVQSPLGAAGIFFVYFGIRRYLGKSLNLSWMVSLFVVYFLVHLFFTVIDDNIAVRSVLFDIMLAFMGFLAAANLLSRKVKLVPAARFNGLFLVLHAIFFLCRAMEITVTGYDQSVGPLSLFNTGQYFDALFVGIIWTIGFIIMVNQKLQSRISQAKEHFEKIFSISPDAAIITRIGDGLILNVNDGYTLITGHRREDIIGKTVADVNIWKNPEERKEFIDLIILQGYVQNYEAHFQKKTGEDLIGLVSANLVDIDGEPHMISLTRDIGYMKQAELALKMKNQELVKINSERDRFYSIIAHDLRSPFNSFLGLTRMMVDGLPDLTTEEINRMSRSMEKTASNVYNLLENLLSWSRVQQGHMPCNRQSVALDPVLAECLDLMNEQIKTKLLVVSTDIPAGFTVYADSAMLNTILRNLISNAIKFTPAGGSVAVSASTGNDSWTTIRVKDNGIGMDSPTLDALFRPDASIRRKGTEGEPSNGLGLLLCSEFIAMHGGIIRAESEPGRGSSLLLGFPPESDS